MLETMFSHALQHSASSGGFGPLGQLLNGNRPSLPAGLPDPRQPMNMPPVSPSYQRYREMTLDELLLENRIIFLAGEINYVSASNIIMKLLHLINIKKNADIHLYINSPGGAVDDTLMIYDTMQFIECDVATYCMGRAMSGGAIILACGTKGKRFMLPHAKVMIHQPYGGVYGQTSDVKIQAEQILRDKKQLNELLAEKTGRTADEVAEASERDKYFSAEEAKAWGLVDEIIVPKKSVPTPTPTP